MFGCALANGQTAAAETASVADLSQSFFARNCNDCHSGDGAEADLDLTDLSMEVSDLAIHARWVRIFDRVRSGEMPPPDAAAVDAMEVESFTDSVEVFLQIAGRRFQQTVLRRLNRNEYANTLNDLFGTHLDLSMMLPEDGRSHEFDNVGDALGVSMVHLQKYLDAIDSVMDAAIAKTTSRPATQVIQANYAESREGEKFVGEVWRLADDGAVVFFQDLGYPTGMLRGAEVKQAGWYTLRVTGYAYHAEQPITFRAGLTSFQPGSDKPTLGYFQFPPIESTDGQPTTVEKRVWMEPRFMVSIDPWGIDTGNYNLRKQGIDGYTGPGLAINQVELVGPILESFPGRGHELIYAGLVRHEVEPTNPTTKTKPWYQPNFVTESTQPATDAAKVFRRVATAAYRRPVDDSDVQPIIELMTQQIDRGATFDEALRTGVAAIFCSPDFLYLQEPGGKLDDHAIASRLSYFLVRTTPDQALLDAAAAGVLSTDPSALIQHTRRLIADPRHQRFIDDFCDAWLNLREIEFTSPDRTLFPEYDPYLQHSAIAETRHFVSELIEKNLPVRNVVQSDFAFLNERLVDHYRDGLGQTDPVHGPDLQRVQLSDDSLRGGLLSQASVLKVSANGTNTSPVVRGVWVMERILGITPSPPPPGISGVEPDIRGASTLRELLDKHRDLDSCRSCHAMIDPPGFALESFNPIGGYRDRFRSLGEGEKVDLQIKQRRVQYRLGQAVDASGEMQDGRKFDGFVQFRQRLAADEDALARSLATKFLTFATGREMGFSDRPMIDRMVAESKQRGHGVRDILELVVTSEAFLNK
ncbi:hypothetical protein K227x_40890 [Rubripirellula lacrimiformis]|uniref:Planctomycete cytochrome C n=2 Tax=Rubripirellula lacrimiformis TaxID=1930273 RepID=A0A517NEX8_9BACT|nr:hypothetical protein K227x_40890 [Rubripirellula lacrimiformis]